MRLLTSLARDSEENVWALRRGERRKADLEEVPATDSAPFAESCLAVPVTAGDNRICTNPRFHRGPHSWEPIP